MAKRTVIRSWTGQSGFPKRAVGGRDHRGPSCPSDSKTLQLRLLGGSGRAAAWCLLLSAQMLSEPCLMPSKTSSWASLPCAKNGTGACVAAGGTSPEAQGDEALGVKVGHSELTQETLPITCWGGGAAGAGSERDLGWRQTDP